MLSKQKVQVTGSLAPDGDYKDGESVRGLATELHV